MLNNHGPIKTSCQFQSRSNTVYKHNTITAAISLHFS